MRVEIIRPDGDLKREVWVFSLHIGYVSPRITFDSFSFQTRESTRHRTWIWQNHWERLNPGNSTIKSPPDIPPDVESEMHTRFQIAIKTIPIIN